MPFRLCAAIPRESPYCSSTSVNHHELVGEINMTRFQKFILPLGLVLATSAGVAGAQSSGDASSAPLTRKEVKMDAAEFLKTHQWDAVNEAWMVKPDYMPPAGVRSRADVKADRDAWLKMHAWDGTKLAWVELQQPRDMSTLSRDQVKAETKMFLKTHSYDETSNAWVASK
jgi:hypothetical protein